ncbi:MAG: ribosome small subunit-dependent GTPase A [Lachnospiraceae bacterium]|nr:ribosome small subunit-dependent GTPase A [Lachnospiraceae bacterium]
MTGKIVKGIAGFYYVNTEDKGTFECKAKGSFRTKKLKPLVGDDCEIEIINEEEKTGNIIEIKDRHSTMIRPACANVDQALVIFSVKSPDPNFNLLDRFLIYMESEGVPCILCFNKDDLEPDYNTEEIKEAYEKAGYSVLFISAREEKGIDSVKKILDKKTTVVAGPSGVGKSTLINLLAKKEVMETGDLMKKIERGKQTTRHAELMPIWEGTFIMDTPGFTSLDVFGADKKGLSMYYHEFDQYVDQCKFSDCIHINEPGCAVKENVESGNISKIRYENYLNLYKELAGMREVYKKV